MPSWNTRFRRLIDRRTYITCCRFLAYLPIVRALINPPAGSIHLQSASATPDPSANAGTGLFSTDHICEAETIVIPASPSSSGDSSNDHLGLVHYRTNSRFVTTVQDGFYRNASGFHEVVILDSDNRIIHDLSPDVNPPKYHRIYQDFSLASSTQKIDRAVCLTTPGARNNYYHWLIELIPKFFLLQAANIACGSTYKYLINGSRQSYEKQSLAYFGVSTADIIQTFPGMRLNVQTLIVPNHSDDYEAVPRWAVDFLHQAIQPSTQQLKALQSQSSKKLFIYRPQSARRHIANFTEVKDCLEREGYLAVNPGSLTFEQQVSLFRSADSIIAEHGAALANLVFCHHCTSILELFSPFWATDSYRVISYHKGIRYTCLWGDPCTSSENNSGSSIMMNYRIPIDRLMSCITDASGSHK